MEPGENIVTYQAMVIGFLDPTGRFERAIRRREAARAYAGLFEALNWAVALEGRGREHWGPDGLPLGWSWRDRLPDAQIMQAVRFVRNRVHHQWADAMVVTNRTYPYKYPLLIPEWKWRDASKLPPGGPNHPDPAGQAAYEDLLEGGPVRVALDALSGVFYTLQILLEPHTEP